MIEHHDFFSACCDDHSYINTVNNMLKPKLLKDSEKGKEDYKNWIESYNLKDDFALLKETVKTPSKPPLRHSLLITASFKLKKPFISKDDDIGLYVIDNPVSKDKAFRVPYIKGSTWKGCVRDAFRAKCADKNNKDIIKNGDIIKRLFGPEKEGDGETANLGRLRFYDTFFDEIRLDVITPIKRETGTPVRGPIHLETIPADAKGTLAILYFPFDLMGKGGETKEINEDFDLLAQATICALEERGIGAKTSAGYGLCRVNKVTATSSSTATCDYSLDKEEWARDMCSFMRGGRPT